MMGPEFLYPEDIKIININATNKSAMKCTKQKTNR